MVTTYFASAQEDIYDDAVDHEAVTIWSENGNSVVPWKVGNSSLTLCTPDTYFA